MTTHTHSSPAATDRLLRALSAQGGIACWLADTRTIAQCAADTHRLSPIAAAALGRTLTMTAFLAQTLKAETARLSVSIKGAGPLGGILTATDGWGHLKGYVQNPAVFLPPNDRGKLDVAGAVCDHRPDTGSLTVIRDMGLKEPYTGRVALRTGEIAEDFAYYLTVSEQTPSAVSLGVLMGEDGNVLASGGILLQTLPGVTEEELGAVEAALPALDGISQLLHTGMALEDILTGPLAALHFTVLEEHHPAFCCDCSRERLEEVLLSMGNDLADLISDGQATLHCHFCNTEYYFDKAALEALWRLGGR